MLQDTIIVEKKNPVENVSKDSIATPDSNQTVDSTLNTSNGKSDKEADNKSKQSKDKTNPEKSPKKSSSIDDAAKYLDTHNVRNVSEMSQYPDLQNLYKLMQQSLYTCRDRLPSQLVSKSKKLHEISRLLREIEHLAITGDKQIVSRLKKMTHRGVSSDKIDPNLIQNNLRMALDEARMYEKMRKRRSIGGDSPTNKEDADSKEARKKRIQREIEQYKKMVSDSIKSVTPTFELG